ncbi:OsmC/Ohr family [Immersiella caudata]|uniref:OsmC/Ohr family n=1 Tax=Immersiella caudata TaxID=314043 RepID=A0AA39WFZ5_9PEZI|nr:OsmC/Ohr family [Immersiella caudata]
MASLRPYTLLTRARFALPSLTRPLSTTPPLLQSLPLRITGHGSGTIQTVSVEGKPYQFTADTYTLLGGKDSAPSPVSYSLASLSSCNQVTGSLVAKDHGITLGKWHVTVKGLLPTAVLVKGEEGNPNWEGVELEVRVQTDVEGGSEGEGFRHFVREVERRCPITQLFKLSGVRYETRPTASM